MPEPRADPQPPERRTPAFQHAINLVAKRTSGVHSIKPLHEEPVILRVSVANGRDHRRS
jgi:hypothetical protein